MEELGDKAQPHVSGSLLSSHVTLNDGRTSQHQFLTEVRNDTHVTGLPGLDVTVAAEAQPGTWRFEVCAIY